MGKGDLWWVEESKQNEWHGSNRGLWPCIRLTQLGHGLEREAPVLRATPALLPSQAPVLAIIGA